MNSSVAVFLWTFRRKWKGFVLFIAATAVLIFVLISLYPEFSKLGGVAFAEALGGDMEVSLTRNREESGDYILIWSTYHGADGYAVVESDTEIPLPLVKRMDLSGVNLPLLAEFLPSEGKTSIHTFDGSTTQTPLSGLDEKYGRENALVYFGVLAFRGKPSNASIVGASQTVSTKNMVAKGPYDKLMENPLIKSFLGTENVNFYSIRGFLCIEVFNALTLYILIYFIIQYSGAFSCEMEHRTIDLILSTPLSRRRFFISRYLSWAAMNLILIGSWTVFIYTGVLALGKQSDVPLVDIARTMILFLPFMLSVQGLCMLASVMTNESRNAYGVSFAVYYGMYVLGIVAMLSERMRVVRYVTIFHYWDYKTVFIDGIIPWADIVVLTLLSVGLLIAGLAAFERKDLAS